jgi:hypothetical protein
MNKYLCEKCFNPIPAGEAVLRSVLFERVAWHKDCYETRNEETAAMDQFLAEVVVAVMDASAAA